VITVNGFRAWDKARAEFHAYAESLLPSDDEYRVASDIVLIEREMPNSDPLIFCGVSVKIICPKAIYSLTSMDAIDRPVPFKIRLKILAKRAEDMYAQSKS